jgi:ribosomal protein S18 acetylase RimI-like enzyme
MKINIETYTKEKIRDVIDFEKQLRIEEDFWNWEIDENYIKDVTASFNDTRFANSISLLAYVNGKVVGRIDSTLIASHFDGSIKAYLDWICVLKSYRHKNIAQTMMSELKKILREKGVCTLISLIASNEDSQRFYHSLANSKIRDEGIWIDL